MKSLCALLAGLVALSTSGLAASAAQPKNGPWTSGDCVVTKIVDIGPRLDVPHATPAQLREAIDHTGIHIDYATHRWDSRHWDAASVLYQGEPALSVATKQHVGDAVQLCFISRPEKTEYCNPDQDPRGIVFRIYNYRLKSEFQAPNSQHSCGGA